MDSGKHSDRKGRTGDGGRRKSPALAAAFSFAVVAPAWADNLYIDAALGVNSTGVFRGSKSSKLNPGVYGYMEAATGDFYGGVFANPVSIQGELGALVMTYAVWAPSAAGFDFDVGGRYYAFPGSSDFTYDFEKDGIVDHAGRKGLFEGVFGAKRVFRNGRVAARAFYTPDNFAETGPAWYFHGEARVNIVAGFEARGGVGVSTFSDERFNDNYVDYNFGIHKSAFGLNMFARYSDTIGLNGADNSVVVFGVEKSWSVVSPDGRVRRRYRKIMNDWAVDKSLFAIAR